MLCNDNRIIYRYNNARTDSFLFYKTAQTLWNDVMEAEKRRLTRCRGRRQESYKNIMTYTVYYNIIIMDIIYFIIIMYA